MRHRHTDRRGTFTYRYIYTRDLGRFAPRSLALRFAPWCFRLVPHSHNITTYYSKCGHMYCFCLMPHRHDRAISTSDIIQSTSKFKHLFILYLPIFLPNFMSLGLLFWSRSTKNAAILDRVWLINT